MKPLRLSWRLIRRSALIWAGLLLVMVISGAKGYTTLYTTEASRRVLVATLGSTKALDALYGRAVALDTAGGFVAWRYGTFIGVVAGVWALLAVSRLVRGEEDAGRSDVLLAAPIRRRGLLARQLGAALAGALVLGLAVAVGALGSALPVGGSLLFATGAASEAMTFGALAALASQLFGERRRAAGWTGIILGASYLLRAVGDGSNGRAWMVWLSPLGWAERLSPFRDALPVGLVPLIGVPLVLAGASLWLCDHRDVGQGVLTDTGEGRTDTRPMTSPLALDLRLSRGRFLAWAAALGAYGVVLGYLAVDLADYFRRDKTLSSFTRKLAEGASMGSVGGLLGLMFGFLALVLAVYAGSQMVAGRTEEGAGRLDGLLASSVSRARWLWVRIGVGLASIVGLALVMGLATWLGVVATGASTPIGSVLAGALNVVPVALLFGGLSVLAFGLAPRLTAAVAFGAVALAYLVQVIGAIAGAPGWLLDLSPFSHVAAVPAQSANVGAMAVMLALAAATTLAGLASFRRRDIQSD